MHASRPSVPSLLSNFGDDDGYREERTGAVFNNVSEGPRSRLFTVDPAPDKGTLDLEILGVVQET